jgi:hypothetical protein
MKKKRIETRHKASSEAFRSSFFAVMLLIISLILPQVSAYAAPLKAGVAKVNITNWESGGIVKDSVYTRALVLDNGSTIAVIISVDAIGVDPFVEKVRSRLQKELNINPSNVMMNASHLHTAREVCPDIDTRIVKAVRTALQNRVPVKAGAGAGREERLMENKRLILNNGKEWEIRHANPMPPDAEVKSITPPDPEIGILRLDRNDGRTLAVLYNFACHATFDFRKYLEDDRTGWEKVPTSADFPGYASKVIESNLNDGAIAFFVQGFAGDIHPARYKDVGNPRDAEPWGDLLGLSTLQALKKIQVKSTGDLKMIDEIIKLPRRNDLQSRINALLDEQEKLLKTLRNTSLNVKAFIPLYIKYNLSPEYPSYYSHIYMHDEMLGKIDWKSLDDENRINLEKYLQNIYAMEKLSRIQENLNHLRRRLREREAAKEETMNIEIQGLKIGNFVLVTFPAEVSCGVGLNIKKMSPYEFTFTAGYTNGSIGYTPTTEQFKGEDYSDINCPLAAEWQKIYEEKILEIIRKL